MLANGERVVAIFRCWQSGDMTKHNPEILETIWPILLESEQKEIARQIAYLPEYDKAIRSYYDAYIARREFGKENYEEDYEGDYEDPEVDCEEEKQAYCVACYELEQTKTEVIELMGTAIMRAVDDGKITNEESNDIRLDLFFYSINE